MSWIDRIILVRDGQVLNTADVIVDDTTVSDSRDGILKQFIADVRPSAAVIRQQVVQGGDVIATNDLTLSFDGDLCTVTNNRGASLLWMDGSDPALWCWFGVYPTLSGATVQVRRVRLGVDAVAIDLAEVTTVLGEAPFPRTVLVRLADGHLAACDYFDYNIIRADQGVNP